MASWRDSTSQQAQDDLDGLLNAVLPCAEQTLSKYGEMYPFGAAVTANGELKILAGDPGSGDHPASQDVLDGLYAEARQSRAEHRAVAFVADMKANGSDAVRVELEQEVGTASVLLVPYTRSRFKKTVTLGQMSGGVGDRRIWADWYVPFSAELRRSLADVEREVLREEAAQLPRGGVRWQVSYCAGSRLADEEGVGEATFPAALLSEIPTPAQKRKLARGQHDRTYAFARLVEDQSGAPLLLVEEE